MTNQHPITPPTELVRQWQREANHNEPMFPQVANQAAQWGADQQLEEEMNNAKAKKLGKAFGEVLGGMVVLLVMPTIIWVILTFIFTLSIPWVKVFGAYFLFNIFKNIIINSIKSAKK